VGRTATLKSSAPKKILNHVNFNLVHNKRLIPIVLRFVSIVETEPDRMVTVMIGATYLN
jgi:hypothetical protein